MMKVFRNLNVFLTFFSLLVYLLFLTENKYVFFSPYFNVTLIFVFSSVILITIVLLFDGKVLRFVNFIYNCIIGMNFFKLVKVLGNIELNKLDESDLNFLVSIKRIWTSDELKERLIDNLAAASIEFDKVDKSLLENLSELKTMAEIDKHTEFIKAAMAAKAKTQSGLFGFLNKFYDFLVNMDEDTETLIVFSLAIILLAGYYAYNLYQYYDVPGYHKVKPAKYWPEIFEVPTHDEHGNPINPYGFTRGDPRHRMPVIDWDNLESIPQDDSWKKEHIKQIFIMREANWDKEVFRKLLKEYEEAEHQDWLIRNRDWLDE